MKVAWSTLHGSLRARLFIPTAVLAVAAMAGMVFAAAQLHGADLEQASRERAVLFSNLAAEGMAEHMISLDRTELPEVLGALRGHRKDLLAVSLLRSTGEVSHSSDPALVGSVPWAFDSLDWKKPLPLQSGFAVLRPLINELRCVTCHGPSSRVNGWLEVRFSDASVAAGRAKLLYALGWAGLPSLLLLLGSAWFLLGREAVRPIQRLVAAMKRAEAGEPLVRGDSGRPDEIGEAARGFDATLAALRRSQLELERAYEARMVRADQLASIGQMATGLAHEVKNPLAGLSGALELLAEDLAQTPNREVVEEMQHQVDRLAQIMESLLRFARPPRAELRPTDVNLPLQKVLFLAGKQRQSAQVKVETELDPQLPPVLADERQLEQIFLNLILNAFQAMEKTGGCLKVRTSLVEDRVLIELSDSGPGIPAGVQGDIFTPFFTTRPTGTGLGLAICARLVEAQQGRIDFRCPEEGGTVFAVSLPVHGSAAAGVGLSQSAGVGP